MENMENMVDVLLNQMGDYEEYKAGIRELYEHEGNEIKWVTEDGRVLQVREMSDLHLANAMNVMNKLDKDNPWVKIFKDELIRRSY